MTETFQWVIDSYGQEAVCLDKNGAEQGRSRAIVQPITEKEWQYTAGALGSYRTDRFLCLAGQDLPLGQVGDGGTILWGGACYEVMTARPVWVGGRVTHLWMVLRPAEENAE